MLSNLLGNSIQHGDQSAPIELSLVGDPLNVMVEIRNQGKPIPAGELAKIFDPLVRGAGAIEPKYNRPGSIGLGLYIARELVTAHGGDISVQSTAAAGTVFTFHLPRHFPDLPSTPLAADSPGNN